MGTGTTNASPAPGATRSVLFFAPAFLADRRHKSVRGAEVFNLRLLALLARERLGVSVCASSAACVLHARELDQPGITILRVPNLKRPAPTSLAAVPALVGRHFDVMILGNTARGVLPAVRLLGRLGVYRRLVLLSHQFPREDFARAIARLGSRVVAVSAGVANAYRGAGCADVRVRFGIPDAERYQPAHLPDDGVRPLRLAVIGKLESADKRADWAIEAVRMLPANVRARVRLELLGYRHPPSFADTNIVALEYQRAEAMPGYIAGLDAVLIPSAVESFSQVAVQAMLCAKPIAVAPLEALLEKVEPGCGIVADSPGAFARAIERLVLDADLRRRLGETGRRVALDRYVWSTREFVERDLFPDSGGI